MWPDRISERREVQLFAAIFAEIGAVIHRIMSALWPDRYARRLGRVATRWDPRPWDPRFARWDPRHIILKILQRVHYTTSHEWARLQEPTTTRY